MIKKQAARKKSQQNKAPLGQLRIIAGQWRSRRLPVADLPGLRPTTDRVRETLFNWLQNDIPGARCLDVFSGSGALAFEAASRGAAHVTAIEKQAVAFDILRKNVELLDAGQIELQFQDGIQWLQNAAVEPYDIVFLDPPFDADYLPEVCTLLQQREWLRSGAAIYIETAAGWPLQELPQQWKAVKQKKAGQVAYYLYRLEAD